MLTHCNAGRVPQKWFGHGYHRGNERVLQDLQRIMLGAAVDGLLASMSPEVEGCSDCRPLAHSFHATRGGVQAAGAHLPRNIDLDTPCATVIAGCMALACLPAAPAQPATGTGCGMAVLAR